MFCGRPLLYLPVDFFSSIDLLIDQPLQNLFPIVNKHLRDLIAVCLLIGAGMHRPVVESQDLGAGDT